MTLPASFYRAEAAYLEPAIDDLPGDFGPAFPEPECWGFNSYEHYKGECRHFQEDELCDRCGYAECRCDDAEDDSLREWLDELRSER